MAALTAAPSWLLLLCDLALAATYLLFVLTDWGDNVFCGKPSGPDYAGCVDQMALFAVASLIPALLALTLMVSAFLAPSLRERPELRTRTLGYSFMAWLIAGFTFILGGLPSV
ncbi:hypothetical protein [Salinactinospora qingdaonensis]|uniref:Uncharacterized protein n=1 Tax=Salinactinospora qingdaonensis TaxID=702744 RepID=A0ABP7GAJ0_9ACTN